MSQFLLKPILFHLGTGETGADAIFADFVGLDSQVEKHVFQQRVGATVLFQFHHHQGRHRGRCTVAQVLEAQVAVDGESLGLGIVHQSDSVENGDQMRTQRIDLVGLFFRQKRRRLGVVEDVRNRLHGDALLLRAAFVVLVFHLAEGQVGIDVSAHANFVAHQVAVVVDEVHGQLGRVVIHCAVRR